MEHGDSCFTLHQTPFVQYHLLQLSRVPAYQAVTSIYICDEPCAVICDGTSTRQKRSVALNFTILWI